MSSTRVWLLRICVVPLEDDALSVLPIHANGAYVNVACQAKSSSHAEALAAKELMEDGLVTHHVDSVRLVDSESVLGVEGLSLVQSASASPEVQVGTFYIFTQKL